MKARCASIGIDADARSAAHFTLVEEPGRWAITQHLVDPDGDGEWRFAAVVDLATPPKMSSI